MLRFTTLCAVTITAMTTGASAEFLAERGAYLVNGVGGCNNCHTFAPGGQSFANIFANAAFADLQNPKVHNSGCLADRDADRGRAPRFALPAGDRKALRLFLAEGGRLVLLGELHALALGGRHRPGSASCSD